MWLLSWFPYAVIFGLSGPWVPVAWTAEILLGITGLALAGTEFAKAIKGRGWKGAVATVWASLIHGSNVESESNDEAETSLGPATSVDPATTVEAETSVEAAD
jgi:hypothetical protein